MAKKVVKKKKVLKKKKTFKEKKPKKIECVSIEISILKKAPKKNEFVLADGRKLNDLKELAFALGDMADDVFWHHVNDARNDFASWVDCVFEDKELAEELNKVKDKFNTQLEILKHIVKKL